MANIVVLNSTEHRALKVDRQASAKLGDNQRFVQATVQEFSLLAVQYPILLSKDSDTGRFFCGAMLGFDDGENLFLKDGGGHEGYRPLNLQRVPFFYVAEDTLAIDLDSPRVGEDRGEALFGPDGAPGDYLKSVMGALRDLRRGIAATEAFIDTLLRLKLVIPIEVKLDFDDGSSAWLQDLYTVRREALSELPDDEALKLFRSGYLYLIDVMSASVQQIARLAERKNDRLAF